MRAEIKPRIELKNRPKLEEIIPLATPLTVFVDPSSICNLRCKFCPTGDSALMKQVGQWRGTMNMKLFKKIIDDIEQFPEPIKVLRMYKDGEPLLNKDFVKMVQRGRQSKNILYIDTTTNGILLTPQKSDEIIEAGISRINISVNGISDKQFEDFSGAKINFKQYVDNIAYLYHNKWDCEICIKATTETIGEENKQRFYDIFGNICDRIFVENAAPCWPEFDVKEKMDVKFEKGVYQNELTDVSVCPYIFYSISINSDGTVSACFLDWDRKLLVGNVNEYSLKDIWGGFHMSSHRRAHLKGYRYQNPICKNCGQLTHCMPDNIDKYAKKLLNKMAGGK